MQFFYLIVDFWKSSSLCLQLMSALLKEVCDFPQIKKISLISYLEMIGITFLFHSIFYLIVDFWKSSSLCLQLTSALLKEVCDCPQIKIFLIGYILVIPFDISAKSVFYSFVHLFLFYCWLLRCSSHFEQPTPTVSKKFWDCPQIKKFFSLITCLEMKGITFWHFCQRKVFLLLSCLCSIYVLVFELLSLFVFVFFSWKWKVLEFQLKWKLKPEKFHSKGWQLFLGHT